MLIIKKTIIAIWHTENTGKTETIRRIAHNLMELFPDFIPVFPDSAIVPLEGDFRLIIEINGITIGLESQGDPNTDLRGRLEELVEFHCDIIFCTTRTRGETVRAVDNIANDFGYNTIWTSTYQTANNHQQMNNLKARHLINLIQELELLDIPSNN